VRRRLSHVPIVLMACFAWLPACESVAVAQETAEDAPRSLWGYVDTVDGQTLTLDDGSAVTLTDGTTIIGVGGTAATPADITRGVKAEVHLDAEGNATRVELLPAPLAPEYYLSTLTVRGATVVTASVNGRAYPRSLSAIKAPLAGRPDAVSLEGGIAYQPPKDAKAPSAATFAVVNAANDMLFQRTVKAGEAAPLKLSFPAGTAQALTLTVSPVGEGVLRPDWCLWLDCRLVAPLPAQPGIGVLQSTARALLDDLKKALGETDPGPMAVALFGVARLRDDQSVRNLQEDLVIGGMRLFHVVGKSAQRIELGQPLTDAHKKDLANLGAKCVLTGTVSDRGDLLVVNAALVEAENGQILATARAWQ